MVLYNMMKLAAYGALVFCYIMALNWSLNKFIEVKVKHKYNKNPNMGNVSYTLEDIIGTIVYFITWGILILAVFIIIGGLVKLFIDTIIMLTSFEPIAVTLFSPLIL